MIDFRACARCGRAALLHLQARGHTMATGTVKWFNETKGYGFIQTDQGGRDVFVHISAVERSGIRGLAEGQKVSYDVEADRRSGRSPRPISELRKRVHYHPPAWS